MALLPMAVAFLTGKMNFRVQCTGKSIIGLKKYTVLVFRILCFAVVATTIVGIVFLIRGIKKKDQFLLRKTDQSIQRQKCFYLFLNYLEYCF